MPDISTRLQATGIRMEEEHVVPCNGINVALPYMVLRQESEMTGDDAGRIQLEEVHWTVALFSQQKAPDMERKIKLALAGLGRVKITSYPDGTPYETNFEFMTKSILK